MMVLKSVTCVLALFSSWLPGNPPNETSYIQPYADIPVEIVASTPIIAVETLVSTSMVDSVALIENAVEDRTAPQFTLPLDYDTVDPSVWGRPHHDYPALDVQTPVGSPVFAITSGVITQTKGNDGSCGGQVSYRSDFGDFMYCHLSKIVVRSGDVVEAGQLVGYSGGRPGAYGAGSSTVAHLHVAITKKGVVWCVQPLLVSIANGEDPDYTNTTRCHT